MNRFLLLFGTAGLLLAAGCRKDDSIDCAPIATPPTPAPPTSNLSLAEFTRRNAAPVQLFKLTLNQDQTFTTRNGATLSFPANSFLLPTKALATDTARARFREITSVADMVLADMPTDASTPAQLLVSGGEFNIQVWQGPKRLTLSSDTTVTRGRLFLQTPKPAGQDSLTTQQLWKQPLAPNTGPGLFLGRVWSPATTPYFQTTATLYRVAIPLDSIGWWNIDQFWHAYAGASLATLTITAPAAPASGDETRLYLRPVRYNGLSRVAVVAGAAGVSGQARMPTGATMLAIVLQSIGGQLYYGTQRLTVQAGLVVAPPLTAVSEAEAVRLIRQL